MTFWALFYLVFVGAVEMPAMLAFDLYVVHARLAPVCGFASIGAKPVGASRIPTQALELLAAIRAFVCFGRSAFPCVITVF